MCAACLRGQQHRVNLQLFGAPGLRLFLFPGQEMRSSKTELKKKNMEEELFFFNVILGNIIACILLIPCMFLKHVQLELKMKLQTNCQWAPQIISPSFFCFYQSMCTVLCRLGNQADRLYLISFDYP